MTELDELLEQNRRWAAAMKRQDAEYFSRHVRRQAPAVLWIGCSDSRVPVSRIIDAAPGAVFVHRNIANVVKEGDPSCTAVLHYALEVLRVRHIVICGHTGCGGVAAAMDGEPHGVVDEWVSGIKEAHRAHAAEMDSAPAEERLDLMCELNIRAQLRNAAQTAAVQRVWREGRPLTLHGWLYNLRDGLIKKVEVMEGAGE